MNEPLFTINIARRQQVVRTSSSQLGKNVISPAQRWSAGGRRGGRRGRRAPQIMGL